MGIDLWCGCVLPDRSSIMTTSSYYGAHLGLNPCAGPYTLTTMMRWGHPIGAPVFQPSARSLSHIPSGTSTNQDSTEDYLENGGNIYWNPTAKARRISMVGPHRFDSCNSSGKYPTIRGSMGFDAWTPSNRVVQNLNLDFNAVQR
jgi:hypothetical protein